MTTAKKKTSAKKRTVKYAKAHTAARAAQSTMHANHTSAHTAARAAMNAGQKAVSNGANEWQKGANEWAKNSAKMYQFPFAQGEGADVAKTAASTMQSATENMMKMGSDMMQQMFGQAKKATNTQDVFSNNPMTQFMPSMNQFDASGAQEKFTSFARESAEQLSKSTQSINRAMSETMALARENGEALAEVSGIATTVSKQLSAELVSYMNKMFSQNVELSKQVLSCRTLNDMFDLSSRLLKTNLDGFFTESVRMSEMLFQCATDVSEPLNERVSDTAERMTKAMAA